MERETKKLTAPSGKPFEIKEYLTARERNQLRGALLTGVSVDPITHEQKIGDIDGARFEEMEHAAIAALLVSFDGSSENMLDRLLDGKPDDYDAVVAECNKAANFKQAN